MRKVLFRIACIVAMAFALVACNGNGPGGIEPPSQPQHYTVSGKVEKGPLVSGSTISMQLLDDKMQPTGAVYNTFILDNVGSFTFGSKEFDTPYADLTANGYFFNEVSGVLSTGMLSLRAVVDISNASTTNVNILTHIKYQRVLNLIASGMTFDDANKQAQKELFKAFGFSQEIDVDASRFSIIGGDDNAGILILISSLLLIDRNEAELTEYLSRLCREFASEGLFSQSTQDIIGEDVQELRYRLETITENIVDRYANLGMSVEVPNLKSSYDWDGDGIPGNEAEVTPEVVVPEQNLITNLYNDGATNTNGVPVLGEDGKLVVASMAHDFVNALANYSLIQQYYHYNTEVGNLVSQNIYPSSGRIEGSWSAFYKANNKALLVKYADEQMGNQYQEYCNFFTALQYYYMTTMWGDVPYISNYEWYSSGQWDIERTDMYSILQEQICFLEEALERTFEEKRNNSLNDINDFFFVSKDVARVLLAEISLAMGDYNKAADMLRQVIEQDFYKLTNLSFSDPDTFDESIYTDELIFAFDARSNTATRSNITIAVPPIIPVQTLTEVMLLYAEASYHRGIWNEAYDALQTLAAAKGIAINPDDILQSITDARKELLLYSVGNFAYMKRNNLFMQEYGVGEQYMLLPIPQQEMITNRLMKQNPGY